MKYIKTYYKLFEQQDKNIFKNLDWSKNIFLSNLEYCQLKFVTHFSLFHIFEAFVLHQPFYILVPKIEHKANEAIGRLNWEAIVNFELKYNQSRLLSSSVRK